MQNVVHFGWVVYGFGLGTVLFGSVKAWLVWQLGMCWWVSLTACCIWK